MITTIKEGTRIRHRATLDIDLDVVSISSYQEPGSVRFLACYWNRTDGFHQGKPEMVTIKLADFENWTEVT